MFSAQLSAPDLAGKFALDRRLRIPSVLQDDVAQRALQAVGRDVPFDTICHVNGQNLVLSDAQLQQLDTAERRDMHESMMQAAAQGVGFHYGGYFASRAEMSANAGLKFLYDLFCHINSPSTIELIRSITGFTDITRADGQFTRYKPGDYLTRHLDNPTGEERRVAYVLSFTENWHPDWGGLLQFYENTGEPRDAWAPLFNSLTLFDVRHVHAVTYIAPYAQHPRYSLTGWFYAR